MAKVIVFLSLFSILLVAALLLPMAYGYPEWAQSFALVYRCVVMGGVGGAVYCVRAVYLNACVKGRWSPEWEVWYYIRPFVSLACGGVSYLFLKAGLLLLESQRSPDASDLGFLALAFIAGLNVDRFIGKIEEIAQASWGIEKSRTAKGE